MSRLGKSPIFVPKEVDIQFADDEVLIKGPLGFLSRKLDRGIKLRLDKDFIFVELNNEEVSKAIHGLNRALLALMIRGVSQGFSKTLSMIGVGYRAILHQGMSELELFIGKSCPARLKVPKGLRVVVDKNVTIVITGIDKQEVGQFAAKVRGMLPPEPYKGKGIRYQKERVRKKAGKSAKSKRASD